MHRGCDSGRAVTAANITLTRNRTGDATASPILDLELRLLERQRERLNVSCFIV